MGRRDHPLAQHQEPAHRDPPETRPAPRSGGNRCAAATGLSPELETKIRRRFDESAHRCPDPGEEEIHAAARVTARRAPPTPPTRRAAPPRCPGRDARTLGAFRSGFLRAAGAELHRGKRLAIHFEPEDVRASVMPGHVEGSFRSRRALWIAIGKQDSVLLVQWAATTLPSGATITESPG